MLSTMEKISTNKVKLRLTLETGAFDEALQKAYVKMRGKVSVPGFRKGKAPRKLIERMYGENVFHEDAFQAVFPDMYEESVKEHGITPVARPDINIETIGQGQGLVVSAEVYVTPDVTLGQYRGLEVTRDDDSVDEDAIEQAVLAVQKRNAREVEVDDRPVQDDDVVTLNYEGTVDGVAFEGGTAEKQKLTIGSGSFIPGFEAQMVGMCLGEEKDINVTFPGEYHAKELAGKDAVFHVKVLEIRVREMPELDDELAKDLGFETLDEYKADIRAKLEAERKKAADSAFENSLVEAAMQNAEVDIPEPMIEREIDTLLNDFAIQMAYRGVGMEDYFRYTGQTPESMREQRREEATKRVKGDLVLKAIASAEDIVPSREQIDEVIEQVARSYQKDNNEDFRNSLTEKQMEAIKEQATTVAVLKLLWDEAKKPE